MGFNPAQGVGITELVQDESPELAGNLDVHSYDILSSDGTLDIYTDGQTGGGVGYSVNWYAADGTTGNGGVVYMQSGYGGTNSDGGRIDLWAGDGDGSGDGGSVRIKAGGGGGSGSAGTIAFYFDDSATVNPVTITSTGVTKLHFAEVAAPTGTANTAKLYAVDNGSGKTQLAVIFGTGAAQILATEP